MIASRALKWHLSAASFCCFALNPSLGRVAGEPYVVIQAGQVLLQPGAPPAGPSTIIVKDGKIVGIRSGYETLDALSVPSDTEVVDLKDQFVLPGLIDSHVHLTTQTSQKSSLELVTKSSSALAIDGAYYARITLLAGFTTVRDAGGDTESVLALRDAITAGLIPGPRLLVSGAPITATGGHGDVIGYRSEIILPHEGVCDGADDCRRAVRGLVKRGVDFIKVIATGGVLSDTQSGLGEELTDDELRAIVETAHSLGRKVAAHAHGTRGVNAALLAGVDSIEHGTFLDERSVKLFKKTGAYLVPTLLAGQTLVEHSAEMGYYPPAVQAKAIQVGPRMQAALGFAYRNGARIVFGTDSSVSPHGQNAREFRLMVRAGMSPTDALRSATSDAAALLGISAQAGTIKPGKFADLIAVQGNPLIDLDSLLHVSFVMRSGIIYKRQQSHETE